MMKMVDDVHNGVTFLFWFVEQTRNDLPDMIRSLKGEYILRTSEILKSVGELENLKISDVHKTLACGRDRVVPYGAKTKVTPLYPHRQPFSSCETLIPRADNSRQPTFQLVIEELLLGNVHTGVIFQKMFHFIVASPRRSAPFSRVMPQSYEIGQKLSGLFPRRLSNLDY